MESSRDTVAQSLLSHVLVPVAGPDDAGATARALDRYSPGRVTVLYVVEKGEGVPDKTPVEQSEQIASESFEVFRETFPDADEHTAYRRDVVDAIQDVASELDVSAVAFRPREASRITRFLSGDIALRLITELDRPAVSLPTEGGFSDTQPEEEGKSEGEAADDGK